VPDNKPLDTTSASSESPAAATITPPASNVPDNKPLDTTSASSESPAAATITPPASNVPDNMTMDTTSASNKMKKMGSFISIVKVTNNNVTMTNTINNNKESTANVLGESNGKRKHDDDSMANDHESKLIANDMGHNFTTNQKSRAKRKCANNLKYF
jgi:hypothetical protein